jgi:hypothetical protein
MLKQIGKELLFLVGHFTVYDLSTHGLYEALTPQITGKLEQRKACGIRHKRALRKFVRVNLPWYVHYSICCHRLI